MRYCICLLRNHISTVPCQQQCRRCPHWPRWPLRRLSHCLCLPSTQHRCLSSSSSWVLHSHRKVPNAQLQLDLSPRSPLSNSLPSFRVQYLPENKVLNRETTAQFKQVSLRLLDRFVRDVLQRGLHHDRNHARRHSRCSYPLDSRHSRWQHWYWLQRQIGLIVLPTPSSLARHPHLFLPCLWYLPQGGLHIWRIQENSFCHRRVAVRNGKNSFRVNSSQSFNMNYQPPEEVLVIQLHIIPPITVPRVNSLRAWSR